MNQISNGVHFRGAKGHSAEDELHCKKRKEAAKWGNKFIWKGTVISKVKGALLERKPMTMKKDTNQAMHKKGAYLGFEKGKKRKWALIRRRNGTYKQIKWTLVRQKGALNNYHVWKWAFFLGKKVYFFGASKRIAASVLNLPRGLEQIHIASRLSFILYKSNSLYVWWGLFSSNAILKMWLLCFINMIMHLLWAKQISMLNTLD